MKKLGIVLGVAAVATITGCRDADFDGGRRGRPVVTPLPVEKRQEPAPAVVQQPPAQQPTTPAAPSITVTDVEPARCKCAPGTKHSAPCACGAPDCKCVAEATPAPVEPEYTVYVVQRGDYLAKISKKYNITLAALRRANPSVKNDVIRIGQKIRLPGKVEVGEQKTPTVAAQPYANGKKVYSPYAGATKEYVVKSGDTLGGIAYRNGISVRQLKELNGLASDMVRVGRKLQVPADGKPAAKAASKAPAAENKSAAKEKKPAVEATAAVQPPPAPQQEAPAAVEDKAEVAEPGDGEVVTPVPGPAVADKDEPETAATISYVVCEGDDITSVSIQFGVSAAVIRELNNLGDNDQLKTGQVIKLPAGAQQ